jgi:hypothetical protein
MPFFCAQSASWRLSAIRLAQLAQQRALVADAAREHVARELLRQRGAALYVAAGGVPDRDGSAPHVDAVVLVEAAVLGRDQRLDDVRRDLVELDRLRQPLADRRQHLAIGGDDARRPRLRALGDGCGVGRRPHQPGRADEGDGGGHGRDGDDREHDRLAMRNAPPQLGDAVQGAGLALHVGPPCVPGHRLLSAARCDSGDAGSPCRRVPTARAGASTAAIASTFARTRTPRNTRLRDHLHDDQNWTVGVRPDAPVRGD